VKTDLTQLTANELVALYRKHKVSPVEVVAAILERCERVNPHLNALSLIDADAARRQAKASEKRWRKDSPSGPVDGVPVTVKELVRVAGWPTLMGSRLVDPAQPWNQDSPAVARLRDAGAVLLGQSTSPEYGHKGVTDSPLHGITRNPWNTALTPGGSSGGAGAAVAAGLGPLAIGTDGGGSIRIPASFCGIVGLKATFGRVAAWPPSLTGDLSNTGPMARTAEDAALMMNVIARPDVRDPGSLPDATVDYLDKVGGKGRLRRLRAALVMKFGDHALDPAVESAVRRAAHQFEQLGCTVEEIVPDLGGVQGGRAFGVHWLSFVQHVLALFPEARYGELDPSLLAMARAGQKLTSAELVAAMADRRTLAIGWNRVLSEYDIVLAPTVAVPAFAAGVAAPPGPDGNPNMNWSPYTAHFNLSRHPAISVPCGLTPAGLPVGLQIVAAHYRDAFLLRVAHRYQRAFPVPRPNLPENLP